MLLLCALFTLGMLYHYVVPLGALPYTEGIKGHDCGQMVWNLWVVNESVTRGHNPYRTGLVYYPEGASLVYHTMAAGFFPVTFLVRTLSGGSPLYPFYAYRLIVLLSFTLILFFSYATMRGVGFTRRASAIAATAYAFSDFYMEHVIHINHLAGFFIPATALALVRLYRKPRVSRAIVLAVVASLSVYFTEFSLYVYMAAGLFALLMLLFRREREELRERVRRVGLKGALLSAAVFILVALPYLYNLLGVRVLKPNPADASLYSSNLAGFFIPGTEQTPLYGQLFAPLRSRVTAGMGEPEIFLGFPFIIFALVALLKVKDRLVRLSAVASCCFLLLSLGPTLKVFGTDTGVAMPYALLARVPPFDLGRTPVRFIVMGLFFLMLVAGAGLSWLERTLPERRGKAWGSAAMALLFVWAAAEGYAPAPRQKPFAPPAALANVKAGGVLNLPLLRNDGYAAMLQVFHQQPIATGYLARYTAEEWKQFGELERSFNRGGAQFCERLKSLGFTNIIIAPKRVAPDAPSTVPLELSRCALNVIDLREPPPFRGGVAVGLEEQPEEFPPYEPGTRLDFRAPESDKYLWYGWSGREPQLRWSNGGRAAIVFSLERPQSSTLEIRLGAFLAPGKLERQRVEVGLNGRRLTTLELKDAGPQVYRIELPSPAEKNVLSLGLPDSESPAALGLSGDERLLGVNVQWMRIDVADK
ncbi:MAG TPA: hypothetical protein VF507_09130 [Pyrinomonadaceae bacterium]